MIKRDLPLNFFRHEVKFVVIDLDFFEIENLIKCHPACFSEIFYKRRVNNLYFDSINHKNYEQHLDGNAHRIKIRIRWYGNLFGLINAPVLEFKIKEGILVRKKAFKLVPFILNGGFDLYTLQKTVFEKSSLPNQVLEILKTSYPTLLNSFERKYFLSADKKVRMTLDRNLEYFKIKHKNNNFNEKIKDQFTKIIEIKCAPEVYDSVAEITQYFPFRIIANSKYLRGVGGLNF